MKFCQSHWDKLKSAIEARGLMSKVATSGEQAAAQIAAGKPDPLMAAHNAIVSNALGKVGLELMMPNDDGSDRCPICYLVKLSLAAPRCECGDPACTSQSRADNFERWIEHAADDQVPPPEERS
jgi:hypothetical protein